MGETPLEGLSQQELEQRLAHALAVGDDAAAGSVEILLSRCLLDDGDAGAARLHGERAVALQRRRHPVDAELARALDVLGRAAQAGGDEDAATGAFLEAIDVAGRFDQRDLVAALLSQLGGMAATAGDRGRARDLLSAALRTAPEPREDGARRAELGLAAIELDDGDDSSAARRALRVLHGGARGETALDGALLLHRAGEAAASRGDHETARRRCELALPTVRELGSAGAQVALLHTLAAACRHGVDLPAARDAYEDAVEQCEQLGAVGSVALGTARSALLLELGAMCLVDMADPAAAIGCLETALGDAGDAGLLDRRVEAARRLHQAATALGDTAGVRRWRALAERTSFVAVVARDALALAEAAESGMPTAVFGDTGGRPVAVRVPGGRVSDGLLWRRRLAAELRRTATRRRVAVVRRRVEASVEPGSHAREAPLGESLQLLVIDRDGIEARVAAVSRGSAGLVGGAWLRAGDDWLDGDRDRLVEALREALG